LTQRLLTFAKGGDPIKKPISLHEIVTETATLTLAGSNSMVELSLPGDLHLVSADCGQLSQALGNLLINADQAMPGGGEIRVQGENITVAPGIKTGHPPGADLGLPPGKYVKITVSDQGMGIPAEYQEIVFEPFFSSKYNCSGLGLTTAYSIIKNHQGYLKLASQAGAGASFSIYLPALEARAATAPKTGAAPLPGQGNILIMDDDEKVRTVLEKMLRALGYEVASSGNGAEAVALYREAFSAKRPYTAVIFDLTIPGGMGGKEAVAELRKIDPGVKAIVSSGYSDDPIMAECIKYGFSNVICKPYRISELSRILQEVLTGSDR
jgi:CheY-like chemotaxis protein